MPGDFQHWIFDWSYVHKFLHLMFGMNIFHMVDEDALLIESFATFIARKWLFSSVNQNMSLHILLGSHYL